MKFIASSSELLAYLQSLNKVVPSRSIVPLVENFLFDLTADGLKITATDLETTLIAKIELDNVDGEGKVAIESKRLLDILKEFPQQPLSFEINEESFEVIIRTETGKYSIPCNANVDEFPEPAALTVDKTIKFLVSSDVLKKGINSTFFATSDDDMRPVMNGIFIEIKPDNLTFVASDSHKLVRYRRYDFEAKEESSFILAKKPAELLRNILAKNEDDIKVEFDGRNAVFTISNFTVVCRLVEGTFPDYENVMPKNNDKKVDIDSTIFHNTIKRVSLFANEASKLVKFRFEDNTIEITAQDIDFSISAYEKVSCFYDGEPISIGFKSTFLLDILQNMDTKDVSLSMSDNKRASLVFPAIRKKEYEDVIMLVMPMMIDED